MFLLDQAGAGSDATFVAAPPDLRGLVEHAWIDRTSRHGPWRVVPDVSGHLLFTKTETTARLVVIGARSTYHDLDPDGRLLTIGLRLRPGALAALFRTRADALTDLAAPVDSLLRGKSTPEAKLAERPSVGPMWDLVRRLEGRDVDLRVMRYLLAGNALAPARTLRRVIQRDVGLSPSHVRRVLRLHGALHRRLRDPESTWAALAHASGYCDQSHLVREFQALLGESPSQFVRRGRSIQDDPREPG